MAVEFSSAVLNVPKFQNLFLKAVIFKFFLKLVGSEVRERFNKIADSLKYQQKVITGEPNLGFAFMRMKKHTTLCVLCVKQVLRIKDTKSPKCLSSLKLISSMILTAKSDSSQNKNKQK